jgi:hypothetical protein
MGDLYLLAGFGRIHPTLWNRRFVEIYTETADGRLTVDYGRIHDTEEAGS